MPVHDAGSSQRTEPAKPIKRGANSNHPRPDPVPEYLRAIEREVEAHHLTNPLLGRRFGEAGWYFLAFCEELVVREIVQAESRGSLPTMQHLGALADTLMMHAK
jgi:hypothetical protein